MEHFILLPPVAFGIILLFVFLFMQVAGLLSFKNKNPAPGSRKPYACGENFVRHNYQPDYKQYFAFAFFFTIMHVTTLVIACLPRETIASLSLIVLYLLGAVTALFILFRS
jgi:NADH:ubiquinone oxidoreductase subunit 3 (subunit A)